MVDMKALPSGGWKPLPVGKWRHPKTGDVLTVLRQGEFGQHIMASDFLENGEAPKAGDVMKHWVEDLLSRRVEPEKADDNGVDPPC